MPISSEQKRLDKLETHLTPKELAIQLAQEIRWHASDEDFWKAWAKRELRESPFVKPFSRLAQQAQNVILVSVQWAISTYSAQRNLKHNLKL
jgi:hypothetical protein